MIDIGWLLLIIPATFALGGVCGFGALAMLVVSREADAEISR